jgi:hypothetical protein
VSDEVIEAHKDHLRKTLEQNRSRVMDVFRKWDADASGSVSKQEVRVALQKIEGLANLPKQEADALFISMDIDGGGDVEFKELNRALRRTFELQKPGAKAAQTIKTKKKEAESKEQQQKTGKRKGGAARTPAASAEQVEELMTLMADGHLLSAEELAMLEAADAVEEKAQPQRKGGPNPPVGKKKAPTKPAPTKAPAKPPTKPSGKGGGVGKGGPSSAAASSGPSAEQVEELMALMADGHLLSAEELAMLEAADAVEENAGTAIRAGKKSTGQKGSSSGTLTSGNADPMPTKATEASVDEVSTEELMEMMASGHLLSAEALAKLEAIQVDGDREQQEEPGREATPSTEAAVPAEQTGSLAKPQEESGKEEAKGFFASLGWW